MFYRFLLDLLVLCIHNMPFIGSSDLEGPIGSRVASSLIGRALLLSLLFTRRDVLVTYGVLPSSAF
jgi:hypothetical protein